MSSEAHVPSKADTPFKTEANPLSSEMTALDHQVDNGKYAPFPKSNFLYLIVGGIGSGKTTTALRLLKIPKENGGYRKAFNRIYVVSPTAKYDDKWDRLINEVDEEGNYYTECTDDTIGEIIDKIEEFNEEFKAHHKKSPNSLVIIDDCVDSLTTRKKSKLDKLILTLRHLKTTVFLMSQKLNSIPTLIRAQARCITFFPTINKREEQTFFNEINIDEDLFKRIMDFCSQGDDHPFLHVKLGEGKPIFFKKYDRILL
jgi:archaellum component FlaC